MSQWMVQNSLILQSHQSTQQQQEDANRFSHVNLVPMPKYEAMGMKYGSGEREAAVDGHDHGEVLFQTSPSRKHLWDIQSADDTLESIVHSSLSRKRPRSNSECKDQTNLMSLASSEKSHKSGFKTKNFVEDLAQDHDHGLEEEHNIKEKTDGSCSTRQTRAAANHNQSGRRRRDRINQKMKDLQKLVPNGNKTDKASLLDDTIQYLKQLQAQVQFMYSIRSTLPQMAMPPEIQQLQMSLFAAHSMTPSSSFFPCASGFPPPPVLLPSIISTTKPKSSLSTRAFVLPTDPFCAYLAQSMDVDVYSKMVTLYCQEVNKTTRQPSKLIQSQRTEEIKEDKHQS